MNKKIMIPNITMFSPNEFENYLKNKDIHQKVVKTAAGMVLVQATDDGIFQAPFLGHVSELPDVSLKLDSVLIVGTPFQQQVWSELLKIQPGTTCTYQELARIIGRPDAQRAVGNAVGANKIAYFVPCHRVTRQNGELGGYAWGIECKQSLLDAEHKKSKNLEL